jgi:hypothetical protein
MKRFVAALVVALTVVAMALPATSVLAAQTASITLSITIPASPLLAAVDPGCQLTITTEARTATCAVRIRMAQPTLTEHGWRLLLAASGARDAATGATVPASALSFDASQTIVSTGGQAIDPVGGPFFSSMAPGRALDAPQTIVSAGAGFGNGAYTAVIIVRLTAPDGAPAGTYTPSWIVGVANNAI